MKISHLYFVLHLLWDVLTGGTSREMLWQF